jgi:hypothetical protein
MRPANGRSGVRVISDWSEPLVFTKIEEPPSWLSK